MSCKWMLTVILCVLVACRLTPTITIQPPPSVTPEGHDASPVFLCSDEMLRDGQPRFLEPVESSSKDGRIIWIQDGVFVNRAGTIFAIRVIGFTRNAVETYTQDMRVCIALVFDKFITGDDVPQEKATPKAEQTVQPGGWNEDLRISIYLLALSHPNKSAEIIKQLLELPSDKWNAWLREQKLAPDQVAPDRFQNYSIEFLIDPVVNNQAVHEYSERNAKSVFAQVSVAQGYGSVIGTLCCNNQSAQTITVTYGGTTTGTLSSTSSITVTYDLSVKGNPSGKYRVSGKSGYTGWSAAYEDNPPTGSITSCPPR